MKLNKKIEEFVMEKRNELSQEFYEFIAMQKKEIYSELYSQLEGLNKNLVQYLDYKLQDCTLKWEQDNRKQIDFLKLKNFFETTFYDNHSKIIVLGIPEHGNIGDQAIVCGEEDFLEKNFSGVDKIFLSWRCMKENMSYLKSKIKSTDIIMIQGGGFLGTLWEEEQVNLNLALCNFENNPIFIFPQTFWADTEEDYGSVLEAFGQEMKKCVNINVCLREKESLQRFKVFYPNIRAMLAPDMVLCMNVNFPQAPKDEILLCFRKDKEKVKEYEESVKKLMEEKKYSYKCTSTVYDETMFYPYGEKYVWDKLEEFSKAKLVITDRLHGMIFSAIVGTPCIAFDNLSGKVRGVYSWLNMSNNVCMASGLDELENEFEKIVDKTPNRFVVNKDYYAELLECLNKVVL